MKKLNVLMFVCYAVGACGPNEAKNVENQPEQAEAVVEHEPLMANEEASSDQKEQQSNRNFKSIGSGTILAAGVGALGVASGGIWSAREQSSSKAIVPYVGAGNTGIFPNETCPLEPSMSTALVPYAGNVVTNALVPFVATKLLSVTPNLVSMNAVAPAMGLFAASLAVKALWDRVRTQPIVPRENNSALHKFSELESDRLEQTIIEVCEKHQITIGMDENAIEEMTSDLQEVETEEDGREVIEAFLIENEVNFESEQAKEKFVDDIIALL